MSTDLRTSSRAVLGYDDIDRHIRRAKKLRSEAFARGVRRMSARADDAIRRLLARVAAVVRHAAGHEVSARRLAGFQAISGISRNRANRSPRCG